jgi:hypothetical protein
MQIFKPENIIVKLNDAESEKLLKQSKMNNDYLLKYDLNISKSVLKESFEFIGFKCEILTITVIDKNSLELKIYQN